MRFISVVREIEAEQFTGTDQLPLPTGVCTGATDTCSVPMHSHPHVHTAHDNQRVNLADGDWVVPEPDGVHYYPVNEEAMARNYHALEDDEEEDVEVEDTANPGQKTRVRRKKARKAA